MGREIRRVPPNWEHPRWTEEDARYSKNVGEYRSCHDETYADAAEAWMNACLEWEAGRHPERERVDKECLPRYYWEWEGSPPDPELYRPAFDAEPTWIQLYETVSEGSPASPPFETESELIDWLCIAGDYGTQYSREKWGSADNPIPTREQATALVRQGGGMSMMVIGGKPLNTYEVAEELDSEL